MFLESTKIRLPRSSRRITRTRTLRIHLAIALVRLGRIDKARAEVRAYLGKNDPKFTGGAWRTAWFYSDPAIVDREVADLATAGLPEK